MSLISICVVLALPNIKVNPPRLSSDLYFCNISHIVCQLGLVLFEYDTTGPPWYRWVTITPKDMSQIGIYLHHCCYKSPL